MKQFFTVFFSIIGALFFAQNVLFEDVNLKNAIIVAYPNVDVDKDGEISEEEAKTLTVIRNLRPVQKITSAKGIEAFTELTELNLGTNSIKEIDVSKNINLRTLNLRQNNLEGHLDVSNLSQLTNLELNENALESIALPESGTLVFLYLNKNKFADLDVTAQKNLRRFFAVGNQLEAIDISQNTALERLHIEDNKLTVLDLSGLEKLSWVSLVSNLVTDIILKDNLALRTILANNNQLKILNLQDGLDSAFGVINVTNNPDFEEIKKDCKDTITTIFPTGITVTDNCDTLSTELATAQSTAKIGPNPFYDNVKLEGFKNVKTIEILDASGKILKTMTAATAENLNLKDLPNATFYFLKIEDASGVRIFKLLKK
ncbi:MAG: T9SS type A sorting domain-containing protein [Cruoricaptor ignavus]|nr:T9SS type A sorting domain-containing protein [Cruoricaptor ignavus]